MLKEKNFHYNQKYKYDDVETERLEAYLIRRKQELERKMKALEQVDPEVLELLENDLRERNAKRELAHQIHQENQIFHKNAPAEVLNSVAASKALELAENNRASDLGVLSNEKDHNKLNEQDYGSNHAQKKELHEHSADDVAENQMNIPISYKKYLDRYWSPNQKRHNNMAFDPHRDLSVDQIYSVNNQADLQARRISDSNRHYNINPGEGQDIRDKGLIHRDSHEMIDAQVLPKLMDNRSSIVDNSSRVLSKLEKQKKYREILDDQIKEKTERKKFNHLIEPKIGHYQLEQEIVYNSRKAEHPQRIEINQNGEYYYTNAEVQRQKDHPEADSRRIIELEKKRKYKAELDNQLREKQNQKHRDREQIEKEKNYVSPVKNIEEVPNPKIIINPQMQFSLGEPKVEIVQNEISQKPVGRMNRGKSDLFGGAPEHVINNGSIVAKMSEGATKRKQQERIQSQEMAEVLRRQIQEKLEKKILEKKQLQDEELNYMLKFERDLRQILPKENETNNQDWRQNAVVDKPLENIEKQVEKLHDSNSKRAALTFKREQGESDPQLYRAQDPQVGSRDSKLLQDSKIQPPTNWPYLHPYPYVPPNLLIGNLFQHASMKGMNVDPMQQGYEPKNSSEVPKKEEIEYNQEIEKLRIMIQRDPNLQNQLVASVFSNSKNDPHAFKNFMIASQILGPALFQPFGMPLPFQPQNQTNLRTPKGSDKKEKQGLQSYLSPKRGDDQNPLQVRNSNESGISMKSLPAESYLVDQNSSNVEKSFLKDLNVFKDMHKQVFGLQTPTNNKIILESPSARQRASFESGDQNKKFDFARANQSQFGAISEKSSSEIPSKTNRTSDFQDKRAALQEDQRSNWQEQKADNLKNQSPKAKLDNAGQVTKLRKGIKDHNTASISTDVASKLAISRPEYHEEFRGLQGFSNVSNPSDPNDPFNRVVKLKESRLDNPYAERNAVFGHRLQLKEPQQFENANQNEQSSRLDGTEKEIISDKDIKNKEIKLEEMKLDRSLVIVDEDDDETYRIKQSQDNIISKPIGAGEQAQGIISNMPIVSSQMFDKKKIYGVSEKAKLSFKKPLLSISGVSLSQSVDVNASVISRLGLHLKPLTQKNADISETHVQEKIETYKIQIKDPENVQQESVVEIKKQDKELEIKEKEKSADVEKIKLSSKIKSSYSPLKYIGYVSEIPSQFVAEKHDDIGDRKEIVKHSDEHLPKQKSEISKVEDLNRMGDYSKQIQMIQREGKENFVIRERKLQEPQPQVQQKKDTQVQESIIHASNSSLNTNPSQSRVMPNKSKPANEHKNRKIKILDPFAKVTDSNIRANEKIVQSSLKESSVKESQSKSIVNNSSGINEQKDLNAVANKKNLSNTERSKLILDRLTNLLGSMGGDYHIYPGSSDLTDDHPADANED